ncbi:copper homeostasis membrane protein CopD [Salinicola sp. CR57]|uniref:copper homeostasis membrane protein CopD n=1 Tax=Salinicola sp. CR57 TaxID=1949086 RepID=UPI000DA1346D|nr:copper homeostasis membrane protein CopD [Salinicola sp. CR57]
MIDADAAWIASRFVFYLGTLFLWGASSVCLLVPTPLRGDLWQAIQRWVIAALIMTVAATVMTLPASSVAIVGDWAGGLELSNLWLVATQTRGGSAWFYQVATTALLMVVALSRRSRTPATVAIMAALVLVSPVLVGHTALHTGWLQWLHRGNDWLHLLAAGFWFGALYPVVRLLRDFRRPAHEPVALRALMRFSRAGHVAVAGVIATGVANVWLVVGAWPGDLEVGYQRWLWVKIALVGLLTSMALFNRYWLSPRLRRGAGGTPIDRALRRMTLAEIAVLAVVIGLVATFGIWNPSR